MRFATTLLFCCLPAAASVVVYEPSRDPTSFQDWQDAVTGAMYQGFDQPIHGFTINSPFAYFGMANCDYCAFQGQQLLIDQVTYYSTTTITFDTPITAFGLSVDAYGPGGPGSGVQVFTDGTWTGPNGVMYQWDNGAFFGITSDTAFSQIELVTPRDVNGNAYVGQSETWDTPGIWYVPAARAVAMPEPSEWAELTLSLACLGLFACRKRSSAGRIIQPRR